MFPTFVPHLGVFCQSQLCAICTYAMPFRIWFELKDIARMRLMINNIVETLLTMDLKATQCARFPRRVPTCNHAAVCERIISLGTALSRRTTRMSGFNNLIIDV